MKSERHELKLQDIRPEEGETILRIKDHLALARDDLHRREICLTWSGYLAALIEWGLISIQEHSEGRCQIKRGLSAWP